MVFSYLRRIAEKIDTFFNYPPMDPGASFENLDTVLYDSHKRNGDTLRRLQCAVGMYEPTKKKDAQRLGRRLSRITGNNYRESTEGEHKYVRLMVPLRQVERDYRRLDKVQHLLYRDLPEKIRKNPTEAQKYAEKALRIEGKLESRIAKRLEEIDRLTPVSWKNYFWPTYIPNAIDTAIDVNIHRETKRLHKGLKHEIDTDDSLSQKMMQEYRSKKKRSQIDSIAKQTANYQHTT